MPPPAWRRCTPVRLLLALPLLWFVVILHLLHNSGQQQQQLQQRQQLASIDADKQRLRRRLEPDVSADEERLRQLRAKNERFRAQLRAAREAERRQAAEQSSSSSTTTTTTTTSPSTSSSTSRADQPEPGDLGAGVFVDKQRLNSRQRLRYDEGWRQHGFNEYASSLISHRRRLQDFRPSDCLRQNFAEPLPNTSVVICMHNEAWSVLLRTLHSVIDRAPPHLLHEVIIVDDFSDLEYLREPLDEYAASLRKVRIVRNSRREGIIRSRMIGARAASGQTLTFLDSHVECADGWLPPLLDRIARNRSNVPSPSIDVISDDHFGFIHVGDERMVVGGFQWYPLQFNWWRLPERLRRQRASIADPVPMPTMAGGLFTIDREYFFSVGSLDDGMEVWGKENLEMSFRVWMCGGRLELVPCSIIGHVFRSKNPNLLAGADTNNVLKRNTLRLAEVWMDSYKRIVYQQYNGQLGDFGDVSERKALRRRLKCRSFDWYLRTVFPEQLRWSNGTRMGPLRSALGGSAFCLHGVRTIAGATASLRLCAPGSPSQAWMLDRSGQLAREFDCLQYDGREVSLTRCQGFGGYGRRQGWAPDRRGRLLHAGTGGCLTARQLALDASPQLAVESCRSQDAAQRWLLPDLLDFNEDADAAATP